MYPVSEEVSSFKSGRNGLTGLLPEVCLSLRRWECAPSLCGTQMWEGGSGTKSVRVNLDRAERALLANFFLQDRQVSFCQRC